jgi:fructose-bisphosphate aldolase class II
MTIVSILPELKLAQAGGYAVPLFDIFDMHATEGMFQAVVEKNAPVIAGVYSGFIEQPGARAYTTYLRILAEEAKTPVSLMLDHGASFECCMRVITWGFSDVMLDASRLPLEENIAQTRAVVRAAHAVGVNVEAELGHVGSGNDYQQYGGSGKGFTDPASVEKFVAETGVDMLAIAIGTAHGVYVGEPNLDLDLLAEIRRRVDIPLVLHGGTGLSEEQFRGAITAGISKINVATDLFMTATRLMTEAARNGSPSYFDFGKLIHQAFYERCGYFLDVFGCSGKAGQGSIG